MPNKNSASLFGIQVKKALIDKKMTQQDLANQLGVSKQYLWLVLYDYRPNSKYKDVIIETLNLNDAYQVNRREV